MPKRPYIPIIVWAGASVEEYGARGVALVTAMILLCPGCGATLTGNGWRRRIARRKSRGFEPEPVWILVHQLVCPQCRAAHRHPWNFRVLPSFLSPFKHFLQMIRLAVFDCAWGAAPLAARTIEEVTGVDRWLVRIWLGKALEVMAAALPALGAALEECQGIYPLVEPSAVVWQRWWALGLALRVALGRLDAELRQTPGSVLEWMAVLGARRLRWWAP